MELFSNEISFRRGLIMTDYFEKLYYWNEFINTYDSKSICYICNNSTEPRSDNNDRLKDLSSICSCTKFFTVIILVIIDVL